MIGLLSIATRKGRAIQCGIMVLKYDRVMSSSSRETCVELVLATKFDEVCLCARALDVVGKAVYEEEPDDLFQTAASLTGHH